MTWKSDILPSTERYIVMGDMTMRLRSVTSLSLKGAKRSGIHRSYSLRAEEDLIALRAADETPAPVAEMDDPQNQRRLE